MKKLRDGTIYVEVGETFQTEDGTMLRCEVDNGCDECYFRQYNAQMRRICAKTANELYWCGGGHREDGKYVKFVRV